MTEGVYVHVVSFGLNTIRGLVVSCEDILYRKGGMVEWVVTLVWGLWFVYVAFLQNSLLCCPSVPQWCFPPIGQFPV